jgi:hypothetical protein
MARGHACAHPVTMKRKISLLSAGCAAMILFATAGCDTIRDYSVNSYQGVLPTGDARMSGSVAPTAPTAETPNPSIPERAPTAAPAAEGSGTSSATAPTKPADSKK